MRRSYWIILIAIIFVVAASAAWIVYGGRSGADESKASVLPLSDVPASFVKSATKKLPDVQFDHAKKLPNGNFEIRGRGKNGKVREVEINSSGEVVEIE